ncbi:hypothetical protein FKL19_26520 [Raoultella ornithinolytica]|nr:hypothetical protein [Raoultella ornithinolytica]QLK15784.1 hypothetical protein GPJ65_08850 [Raoultella ornithinolytica]
MFKPALNNQQLLGVSLVVLTAKRFRFSLLISQLLAKAIPVRGAIHRKACFRAGFLLFCAQRNSPCHREEDAPRCDRPRRRLA